MAAERTAHPTHLPMEPADRWLTPVRATRARRPCRGSDRDGLHRQCAAFVEPAPLDVCPANADPEEIQRIHEQSLPATELEAQRRAIDPVCRFPDVPGV